MEFCEGDSATWKALHHNTLGHNATNLNLRQISLHPSSCCLCAISSADLHDNDDNNDGDNDEHVHSNEVCIDKTIEETDNDMSVRTMPVYNYDDKITDNNEVRKDIAVKETCYNEANTDIYEPLADDDVITPTDNEINSIDALHIDVIRKNCLVGLSECRKNNDGTDGVEKINSPADTRRNDHLEKEENESDGEEQLSEKKSFLSPGPPFKRETEVRREMDLAQTNEGECFDNRGMTEIGGGVQGDNDKVIECNNGGESIDENDEGLINGKDINRSEGEMDPLIGEDVNPKNQNKESERIIDLAEENKNCIPYIENENFPLNIHNSLNDQNSMEINSCHDGVCPEEGENTPETSATPEQLSIPKSETLPKDENTTDCIDCILKLNNTGSGREKIETSLDGDLSNCMVKNDAESFKEENHKEKIANSFLEVEGMSYINKKSEYKTETRQDVTLSSDGEKTQTRFINSSQSECNDQVTGCHSESKENLISEDNFEIDEIDSNASVDCSDRNFETNNNKKNLQFLNSNTDTIDTIDNKNNSLEQESCNKIETNADESYLYPSLVDNGMEINGEITALNDNNISIHEDNIHNIYGNSLEIPDNVIIVNCNSESDIFVRNNTCIAYDDVDRQCSDIHVAKLCLVEYSDDDDIDNDNIYLTKNNGSSLCIDSVTFPSIDSVTVPSIANLVDQTNYPHSFSYSSSEINDNTRAENDGVRPFVSLPDAGSYCATSETPEADANACKSDEFIPDCEIINEKLNHAKQLDNIIFASDNIVTNSVDDEKTNLNDSDCNNEVIMENEKYKEIASSNERDTIIGHKNKETSQNETNTNTFESINGVDIILNGSTEVYANLSAEITSGAFLKEPKINESENINVCLADNIIEKEIVSPSDVSKFSADESKICHSENNGMDKISEMEELTEGSLHNDSQTAPRIEDGVLPNVENVDDDSKIDVLDSFDEGEKSFDVSIKKGNVSSNGEPNMHNDQEVTSDDFSDESVIEQPKEVIVSDDNEGRISSDTKEDTNIIEIKINGFSSDCVEGSDACSDSNIDTEIEDSIEIFSDDSTTISNSSDRQSEEESEGTNSLCNIDPENCSDLDHSDINIELTGHKQVLSSNTNGRNDKNNTSITGEEFSQVENRDSTLPTIREEREDLSLISLISLSEPSKKHQIHSSDVKVLKLMKPTGEIIEIDEKEECFVEGDDDKGYQLIVGNVVRNIPDFVLYMQDEHVDVDDEMDDMSRTHNKNHVEDIVMMNDDESFITVVNDSTVVKFDTDSTLSDDDSAIEGSVIRRRVVENDDNFSVETNSLTASMENLSVSNEPPKLVHRYNDTLRKKLSKVEKRLSTSLSTISMNFFHKAHTETKSAETAEPSSKGRRPLSGVRKRLSSNRRKVYKIRAAKSMDNEHQQDSDSDGSFAPSASEAVAGTQYLLPHRDFKPKEEAISIIKLRKCFNRDQLSSKSFGKRAQGGGRRPNECLILEPSEMMVIDYPDVQLLHPGQRTSANPRTFDKLHFALDPRDLPLKGAGGVGCPLNPSTGISSEVTPIHYHGNPHLQQLNHDLPDLLRGGRSRGSVGSSVRDGSDTSSAYSGSDTMCQSIHSLDHEDVDLSGLMESVVDSDEEDLVENVESMSVQDTVRECLEKDPSDRSENDIKVLLEFTERLSAFANFTVGVRRAMCQAMVFAVVEEADTILMNDGEELDSWSVIINGHVEVTHLDGTVHKLFLGDSFGITPTMEKLYHRGVMRSKVDDCQFVCIRQSDYYRILRQGEENTRRHEEDGVLVLVTEKSHIDTCHREANIVIKGTAERLMLHLVEVENILDTTYVEDFLLTHRKFIVNSVVVAKKLLDWFDDPKYQDIVTRVFLRWVQSYFTDFEMDPDMMMCLEKFEQGLMEKEMTGQLFFLRMVCMTKARSREVTLTRPSRDKPLQFTIVGRKNYGIFISSVEKGSKAEEVGLKRADQILEANGQSFANISRNDALETLKSTCHLAITVRSNLHTFNDMLQTPENAHKSKNRKTSDLSMNGSCQGHLDFVSTLNLNTAASPQLPHNRKEGKGTSMTLKTHKFKEFLASIVTKSNVIDDSVSSHSSTGGHLYRSRSNPDLSTTEYEENGKSEFPDHVLKVYRATDHSARFLPVHKETTAREVVMLALSLFSIAERSQEYALYEVSATEGPTGNEKNVKQKKLPDGLQNLAERIGLGSRYYLKKVTNSQNQYSDEVVNELLRESQVSLLQLSSVVELAIQLTLEDFAIFRQIEPTEYIDNLFKIKSKYGTPALSKFEQISNRELFWVCTEVCTEHNVHKRAKIVKQFIKIARYCKDLNNFNSMFAILSGLGSTSVNRLRQTWARVPNRYRKIFSDLETVMDPSQNMKNYRKLANTSFSQSPMIPFYPIVKKDLLFLNEGNDDEVDGLINFEKLRTISKSIRKLGEMCSTKYCPNKMLEKLGQPQSTAMTAMNQGITGSQQSSTVKRRKKSTAQPDKKKMFEEAQMVRRVKAYLSQLKVITDEDTLMKMSYECEPPTSSHMSTSTHAGGSSTSSSSISSGQQSGTNSAPPSNPQTRRRHHSPTPSTTSSNSSNSHTSEGKKTHARFGAASPTSERKMLSLAEATKKPYHGPRPPTTANTLSQSSLSPNPSPGALRRGPAPPIPPNASGASVRPSHERSHSDIPVNSVDLNAESSSVTSLSSYANLRKSHTSASIKIGSMTSGNGHEAESDVSSHFDCQSTTSSLDGPNAGGNSFDSHYPNSPPSPHSHHRRLSHQTVGFKPPFPHAVAVLPPIPPDAACGTRFLRRGVSGGPPDYTSTQMRIQHLGRALSHDGAHFYHHSRHEDEEDEAQVSAV